MRKSILILIVSISVFGCSSSNIERGSNGMPNHATDLASFNSWKVSQEDSNINEIEHLFFKGQYLKSQLDISKIKGGYNCIPAQIKLSERLSKRFYGEYYNKLLTDAQTTLIKWEQQNKKIQSMLNEISSETACIPDEKYNLVEINNKIRQIEKGGIFFELNNSRLSKESLLKTNQIIYLLKDYEIGSVTIIGHTSNEDTLENNYTLGKERAEKVKGTFVNNGFDNNNLISRSYSKMVNNSQNASQNRRVNIRITEENVRNEDKVNKIKVKYRIKDWDIDAN